MRSSYSCAAASSCATSTRRTGGARLTASGRKVHQDIEKLVIRIERELMAGLDDHEIDVLRGCLDKLDTRLEQHILNQDPHKFL